MFDIMFYFREILIVFRMACARARIESREVLHYLDDFLFGGSNAGECQAIVDIFIDVCKVLGVPIAWGKSEGL